MHQVPGPLPPPLLPQGMGSAFSGVVGPSQGGLFEPGTVDLPSPLTHLGLPWLGNRLGELLFEQNSGK